MLRVLLVELRRDLQLPVRSRTAARAVGDALDRHRAVVREAPPTPNCPLSPGAEAVGQDLVFVAVVGLKRARVPHPAFSVFWATAVSSLLGVLPTGRPPSLKEPARQCASPRASRWAHPAQPHQALDQSPPTRDPAAFVALDTPSVSAYHSMLTQLGPGTRGVWLIPEDASCCHVTTADSRSMARIASACARKKVAQVMVVRCGAGSTPSVLRISHAVE